MVHKNQEPVQTTNPNNESKPPIGGYLRTPVNFPRFARGLRLAQFKIQIHQSINLQEPGVQFPKPPNHQTTKPPNHQTTKPPNHQTTKPPNHQATKPPSHQATKPPSHQATKPPSHQTTSLFVFGMHRSAVLQAAARRARRPGPSRPPSAAPWRWP